MKEKNKCILKNGEGGWSFRVSKDAYVELPDGDYQVAIQDYQVYSGIETSKGKLDQLELQLQDVETGEQLGNKRLIISNQRQCVFMQLMQAVGAKQGKRFRLDNLVGQVINVTLTTKKDFQNITCISAVDDFDM